MTSPSPFIYIFIHPFRSFSIPVFPCSCRPLLPPAFLGFSSSRKSQPNKPRMMAPASPPLPPPPKDFLLDSAATSPYATAPSSPRRRLVPSEGAATGGGLFLTAPSSPDAFNLLRPAATPRLTRANPFDLFQHFTSAPASPRRAAAIYAHFAEGNGSDGGRDGDDDGDSDGDEEEFQRRPSYATGGGSSVPFDWEERPGTPKRGLGGGVSANEAAWDDTEFEFGTQVGMAAPAETLTTADELFEKGKIRPLTKPKTADEPKIRPLKPPPGLLDGGSVASSPMARGAMWSPRRRSRVGSGVDFDPFAAALLEATKAPSPSPSPLGDKDDKGPKKPATRTVSKSRSAGWRRWRLSDLLLFRSSSDGGRVNNKREDPDVKPAQQFNVPVKKASAQPAMVIKASAKGDDTGKDWKLQRGNRNNAAAAADSVAGCARLSPLQRLAKGLGAYSWHHHGGMAAPANKG